MSEPNISVLLMKREDVPEVVQLWMETGMIVSLQSLYSWQTFDPEGFRIAVTDKGEIIGACGAVVHHEDLAMVGMYVVKEKYRGRGIGIMVWNSSMEHIGGRNACLNAVSDLKEKYQTQGRFPILETNWSCLLYMTKSPFSAEVLSDSVPDGVNIQNFEECHLPLIFEYDSSLMGYKRNLAIELNCKEKDSQTLVALKNGSCVGFGTIKEYGPDLVKVGPLYADDGDVAEVLCRRLILSFSKGKGFTMWTFSNNDVSNKIAALLGCKVVEEDIRLFKKKKIEVNTNKLFAMFDDNFSPY